MDKFTREKVLEILNKCWSPDSSTKWTVENPARGQCSVTALVINDVFSGGIMKTMIDNEWHFYNFIDNERVDFTASQFPCKINYDDIKCKRVDASFDTDLKKFQYLSAEFRKQMKEHPELELVKA